MKPLDELLALLRLERIGENVFQGESRDLGYGAVFGGLVLGQALSAASQTVLEARLAHSVHAYFLAAGDVREPIRYEVDRLRDGASFSARQVRAVQAGRAIFCATASFQGQETGPDHQTVAPPAAGPEGFPSEREILESVREEIPAPVRGPLLHERPIEVRALDGFNWLERRARPAHSLRWLRTAGELPDDPALHRCLLAYASDLYILSVSLYPHGKTSPLWRPTMQLATVSHALWFNRELRMDDWLLYEVESPNAAGARGLSLGRVYTRTGTLVASAAQEGLLRERGR